MQREKLAVRTGGLAFSLQAASPTTAHSNIRLALNQLKQPQSLPGTEFVQT